MERDPITGFKIKFNILDYADILPPPPERLEDIINYDKPSHECVWVKQKPPAFISEEHKEREVTRVMRTGVWIYINKQLLWIPPMYYFFLQYIPVAGDDAEFRLKRLKHVYFKIRVRKNVRAIGTFTVKNRQDGETTFAVAEALWEVAEGNMDFGAVAMQSKTRQTVVDSCWRTFVASYKGIPRWLKDILYKDIYKEDKLAEKMKFSRDANEETGEVSRDILVMFGSSTHNAFDSMNNMRRCILDEWLKWEECSPYDTFLNYEKFIAPGLSRKGLFDIFSSPQDKKTKYSQEVLEFWKGSNPDELTEHGTTKTRVFRYYSDPREGVEMMYDKYGDADADEILAWIKSRRASFPKDKVLGEIRAYPLNEEEMFGSFDGGQGWSNSQGIKDRIVYLTGLRFKPDGSPVNIYGNLEWVGGRVDGEVEFRPTDHTDFDLQHARFCFAFLPQNREPLRYFNDIPQPPKYIENCIGFDPFNLHFRTKDVNRGSNAAMVNRQFADVKGTGVKNVPTGIYCCRPQNIEIAFEDALKFAVFVRGLIQVESKSDKFAVYAMERGYEDWLLGEIGSKDPLRKGDGPGGGRNRFLTEGMLLIDANTNLPNPLKDDEPYWLENHWFIPLLSDYLEFNPLDTHANDLSMADIQALVGGVKIMHKKVRQHSDISKAALDFVLS